MPCTQTGHLSLTLRPRGTCEKSGAGPGVGSRDMHDHWQHLFHCFSNTNVHSPHSPSIETNVWKVIILIYLYSMRNTITRNPKYVWHDGYNLSLWSYPPEKPGYLHKEIGLSELVTWGFWLVLLSSVDQWHPSPKENVSPWGWVGESCKTLLLGFDYCFLS